MRGRAALVAAIVALCVGLSGCAIPTQSSPQAIPPSKVPSDLLNPHLPTTTTTQLNPASYVQVKVFLLDTNNQFQPESRFVQTPAPLKAVLGILMEGPLASETAEGVTTALPHDVAVLSVTSQSNNVVTVNMNSAFGQISDNPELAVGQIVATVVGQLGLAAGVFFEINGQHTQVPIANGSEVAGPVYLNQVIPAAA